MNIETESYEFPLYHGSKNPNMVFTPGEGMFGGVFCHCDRDVAESHGDYIYECKSARHISHDDFRGEMFFRENWVKWHAEAERLHPGVNPEYLTGDLYSDDPDVSWDHQRMKGELARAMGYTSVGMEDEHGESVLLLEGECVLLSDD